jgi:AraC-like DNA-binding protein
VPDDDAGRESLVLPDGCSDLVWEQGTGAYVAGPDTGAVPVVSRPGAVFVGVRFRPAHGGQVLAAPLSEFRDQRVGLADALVATGGGTFAAGRTRAARRALATLDGTAMAQDKLADRQAAAALLDLAGLLIAERRPDPAAARAAVLLGDPAARTEDVAAKVGLSQRQFRRRCHDAAGYGPKTLQRVLRFRRFVRMVDASGDTLDLAAAAAAAGYADQAHLTRECRRMSGMSPATLALVRR